MKWKAKLLVVAGMATLLTACFGRKPEQKSVADNTEGFAIVELFTSEGCSSCPSAERVLTELKDKYKDHVYLLEFHVDYWNHLGWKDIYSNSNYTDRQQHYASLFHLNSVYTPQAIVNGEQELIGSDKSKLTSIIDNDLQKTTAYSLDITAKNNTDAIQINYKTKEPSVLNIALVQKDAITDVKSGENGGRKLQHVNIVRHFTSIASKENGNVSIPIPTGVDLHNCFVIAYTQLPDGKITSVKQAQID